MKNSFLVLVAFFTFNMAANAQVGIGAVPKTGSILDLTNSSDKYLILPATVTDPTTFLTDEASVIYHNGNIYLKTTTGFKVFSPWNWNGLTTDPIFSPANIPVGIGVQPIVGTPFLLQVADAGEVVSGSAGNAAIIVGNPNSNHLLIDNNEIMAKTSPNTAGVLKLQEEEGTVEVRMTAMTTNTTVLKANGSIDAAGNGSIKENGMDLVPTGTIVMWYGTVDANGNPLMGAIPNTNWHICDGNSGTPDLRERFIVGAGPGDNATVPGLEYAGYPVNAKGGFVSVAMDTSQMPTHNHSGLSNYDTHDHTISFNQTSGLFDNDGAGSDDNAITLGDSQTTGFGTFGSFNTHMNNALQTNTHRHGIQDAGLGQPHENRPPYYALVFIMKL